jgi:hypothetical protein
MQHFLHTPVPGRPSLQLSMVALSAQQVEAWSLLQTSASAPALQHGSPPLPQCTHFSSLQSSPCRLHFGSAQQGSVRLPQCTHVKVASQTCVPLHVGGLLQQLSPSDAHFAQLSPTQRRPVSHEFALAQQACPSCPQSTQVAFWHTKSSLLQI